MYFLHQIYKGYIRDQANRPCEMKTYEEHPHTLLDKSLLFQVGYEDGIKNHLGGAAQTEAYIASIWTHLQVNYCHSTLGSKVLIERLPGIKHYPGITMSNTLSTMYANTENDIGGFQLEFVSISGVINHMTCYKFECSHCIGGKFNLK